MPKQMSEQEILDSFESALKGGDIYPYYQPQINHSTKRMIGAEALMRWLHPEFGFQSPANFIPILEKNDLIYQADIHIFESVCKFQKYCLDKELNIIPISVNMSRNDIYHHEYATEIEKIRQKYAIPVKYLRVEITETSAIAGLDLIIAVIAKLHEYGYIVEMDDFGSGYSSLNILKNLDVDIIKLDLKFLQGEIGGRGGIILNSIVQMAKWLKTPIIVEGVETLDQADYMKSIGCNYIQGYLYSRPLPEPEFLKQMTELEHEPMVSAGNFLKDIDAGKFWNPNSMETVIFSNLVGPACIFSYTEGKVEILRVNAKYMHEIGMNFTEKDLVNMNPWDNHDDPSRIRYEETLLKAIRTGKEETCETWRTLHSKCCGEDRICVRTSLQVIGHAGNQYLFYALVQNITAEKNNFKILEDSERRFRFASEQAQIYAWEYHIATKQMRPCFRCMRDLNLPPLLENYPEPAIEMGIFPPDYADMYRDWHRQIAAGVPKLEAIIPLTVGRIPFHVRYTTEFDENERPLKAYGSATLVI
ncbi:MAG: EAL domain-containing protein [Desulfovibrionaceae bacterium]|nr:EAL domain-containing protein [Desulfovibrionaceae bacterium]